MPTSAVFKATDAGIDLLPEDKPMLVMDRPRVKRQAAKQSPERLTASERRMLRAATVRRQREVRVIVEGGPDPMRLGDVLREAVARILQRAPLLGRGAA